MMSIFCFIVCFIDNIKRKERAEKLSRRIKYNNKLFNGTVYKNQSYIHKRNENNPNYFNIRDPYTRTINGSFSDKNLLRTI